MKKIILSTFLLGLITSPITLGTTVVALDGGAESGFKTGVNESGGAGATDITVTLQSVINLLLFIAGMIAVIVMVVAGIRYVTSNGDSGATSKARNEIIYAAIGLVLAISAYSLVNFILGRV